MEFSIQKNSGLCPSIVSYLKSIPLDGYSYNHYKLRHPGAIYNLMVGKLKESIVMLSDNLKAKKTENIKSHFRLVLHDFFQFYESCYEIMVCLCEKHDLPKEQEMLHKWLKKNDYKVGEVFFKNVKDHIKELKNYHNEIKHSSNDIQFITFKNKHEITVGYFLDMPKGANRKPYDPISLNLEIRRIYFLIYFISEQLLGAIERHMNDKYEYKMVSSREQIKDDLFQKLYDTVQSLPYFHLLNEIDKSDYGISVVPNSLLFKEKKITESLYEDYYKDGINFEMIFVADGYDNTVRVPMCGITPRGAQFFYIAKDKSLKEVKIIKVD